MKTKTFRTKSLSIVLILCLVVSCISFGMVTYNAVSTNSITDNESSAEAISNTSASYNLPDNIQDGVILHCFDWPYTAIQNELANIAKAGFTAVQTSPAQPAAGNQWYNLYQPHGFYITSNDLGSRNDLKNLCSAADNYGIKVVVDVVANHLTGDHNYIQDDLRSSEFWHTFGSNINYHDRWQVTHGDIGMQDLATENSYVQSVVKNYIQDLKSIGVDGIRFDAAKHIGLPSEGDNFFSTVTSDKSLWYYGEILTGPIDSGGESQMKEYTNYMSVTDSAYGRTLRESFAGGNAPSSYGNWCARGISNNKLVYWAESHDTWSNGYDDGYSWGISQNNIDRAYAVAASRNEISALYFSRPYSSDKNSIKQGQKGSTHFTSPEVAAVNHFHNEMIGQPDYYVTSNNCSVICRQKGAVIVAGSGSNKYVSVTNGGSTTKPGTYIDEITGNKWTVTSTTISGTIGSSGIAVIYNDSSNLPTDPVTDPDTTTVKFTDNQNWGTAYAYFWSNSTKDIGGSWPGTKMSSIGTNNYGEKVFSINIPKGATYVIFTNGSDQTVDIKLTGAEGYYTDGNRTNGKLNAYTW